MLPILENILENKAIIQARKEAPAKSSTTHTGRYNVALVAGPLSPEKLVDPVPAMVVIIPVETVTLRMRWLL